MPGKIYVLLQWVDKPNAITIMEETEDAKKANEGEIIQIKYPNKGVFKAILLHRSESKSFLEKLSKNVNKDGTITEKKKNTSKIEKFKSQSAKEKAESKLKKKMRAQTASKLEDKISEMHPICEDKRKKTTDSAVKNIPVNDFDDNQKDNGMNNEKIDVVTVKRNNLDSSDLEHVKIHSTLDKESEKPSKFNNKNKNSSRIEDKRKKTTDSTSKDISVTDSDDNHEDNGISNKKIDIVTMNEDNLDASEPENVETHLTLENESEKSSKFNKTKKSSRIGDKNPDQAADRVNKTKKKQILELPSTSKLPSKTPSTLELPSTSKLPPKMNHPPKSPSTLELTSTSKSSLINELSLTSGLSLSDEFPSTSVTPEFVNGLEILLKFAKTVVDKNVEVNSPIMNNVIKRTNMVELFKGSSVLINENKLFLMKRFRNNPRELTRQLMLELVGAKSLKTMTALGKKGNAIPENIRVDVYKYVHARNKHFTEIEYISVINYQCGTLRNPKTEKKNKNETNAKVKKVTKKTKKIEKEMDEKEVVEDNKVDHSDEGNEGEDSQDENSEREDSQEYDSDREDSQEQDSEEENENDHEEPLAKKRKL
ncbi:glutamic acid-rich protein-like [Leptopilina boulardi]|uniref:glutamic acid-rich protein-like n=1 Tax=Leptopilina boulardi TaxID=63433 RepID=UPI0021F60690|nr:glutamic acid-rich protein-like [Leptopilina boulardi]